jgi:AraC family ethanolamine operon transcriptional activator
MRDASPSSFIQRHQARTGDVGESARWQWDKAECEYHQVSPSKFSGQLQQLSFGKTQLTEEIQNQTVLKHGAILPARCTVSYLRDATTTGRSITHRIDDKTIFFMAGGTEFDIILPPSEIVFFCFDQAEIQAAANIDGHWLAENPRGQMAIDSATGHAVVEAAELLLRGSADAAPGLAALDAEYLNRLILGRVLQAFETRPASGSSGNPNWSGAWRITQKAREVIDSFTLDPPTVLDVCSAIGVSRRTLQYCFAEIYGISPLAYLRLIRLNRARQAILSARDGDTIAQIAAHWGFWHLGRFAQDYRHLFGELPSDTLLRGGRSIANFG